MLGMIIIERFDIPETFIAVSSSVFLILKKNQIPDNKITNGKKLFSKLDAGTPVCLQDYPPTTTVHFSVSVINRLIEIYSDIVMFKHEDCPGHRKLTQVRNAHEAEGVRRVSILTGNGGLYVPQELRRGADGIMTGFAFPGMLVEAFNLFRDGKLDKAEDLFDLYLPLIRHEQQFGFGLIQIHRFQF